MKNFTLFIFCVLFCSFMYGQNNLEPCGQENPSNWFENGLENTSGSDLIVANDLIVSGGEDFTLMQIIYHSFHQPVETISSVDVTYYSDNNGLPGEVIGSENGVVPSSLIEMGDFGIDIYEVTLDVAPFLFEGDNSDKTYWIGLVGTSSEGGNLWWETTTATASGNPSAQSFEGLYSIPNPDFDGVYFLSGECNLRLNVSNNLNKIIAVYPNPTTDILNLKIPANVRVMSVKVYNILGIDTGVAYTDSTIYTSSLTNGVYILRIETATAALTQKFVKY